MIRGQKKPLESSSKINVDINTSIHNRFDIEVIDSRTGKVRQRAQAENIILDQLWTRLLTPDSYFNYIHYGSGTAKPTTSDTSLSEYIGCSSSFLSTDKGENLEENYFWCRRKAQIPETEAIGKTLSEIGIAYSNMQQHLCTKALIKDMNGNQISIKKTDTDVINIYATVYVHYPNNIIILNNDYGKKFFDTFLTGLNTYRDFSGSVTSRCEYYYRLQVKYVGANDNKYVMSYNDTFKTQTTLDSSRKSITLNTVRLPVNLGNIVGGIHHVVLGTDYNGYGFYNPIFELPIGDNTWYPGSTITGEPVDTGDGSTVDFTTKFRIHRNCSIKVNGTTANNASVDIDKDIADGSYNIHFDTPPAAGDVITADYFTDVIAKDENHVFDFSITFHFGEKVS